MSIRNLGQKINIGDNIYIVLIIILVASASFGLGRLSKIEDEKQPIRLIENFATTINSEKSQAVGESSPIGGKYVVSKNGTKYHLPWCSGALRIKEENKVWFDSKEAAETAGYEPAANCKGI